MPHLDEGTIHAWLDGALPPDEGARIEGHVAECAECAAAVADARGLIAASSRILTALDDVPGEVVPARDAGGVRSIAAARAAAAAPVRRFQARRYAPIAAVLAVLAVGIVVARDRSAMQRAMAPASSELSVATDESEARRSTVEAPVAVAETAAPGARASEVQPRRDVSRGTAAGVGGAGSSSFEAARPAAPAPQAGAMADAAQTAPAPATREPETVREEDQRVANTQRAAAKMAPPPTAPPRAIESAVQPDARLRGIRQLSATELARISGRVTDSSGAAIGQARVSVVGTDIGTITDEHGTFTLPGVPEGAQTVQAARAGYAPTREQVDARAGESVQIALSMGKTAARLDGIAVAGAAAEEAPAERYVEGLTLLHTGETSVNGRPSRRSLYQLRPGVTLTLVEVLPSTSATASDSAASRAAAPPRIPRDFPRQEAKERAEQINTIWWTSANGTEFMLSGAVPVAELESVRRRIERR